MCVYIFSPGRHIQIDYAAEAVSLINGGKEMILDLLITNHSTEPVERIHVVYPYALPFAPVGSDSSGDKAYLREITDTWLGDGPYNRFYQTSETRLRQTPGVGFHEVVVEIPDPSDITKQLEYKGFVRGKQSLTTYEVAGGERLNDTQWKILSQLGWCVVTLSFEIPMKTNDPRWIRLEGNTDTLGENRMPRLEYLARRYAGILFHRFEIAGPKDMRHRLVSALKAASMSPATTPAQQKTLLELHGLQDKLLTRGIFAPNSKTDVLDWRLNVFERRYRRTNEPTFYGDIRPCGPLLNFIVSPKGDMQKSYQWKAGKRNTEDEKNGGLFVVRITAHDIPIVTIILPWIAFGLSVIGFIIGVTNLTLRLLAKP